MSAAGIEEASSTCCLQGLNMLQAISEHPPVFSIMELVCSAQAHSGPVCFHYKERTNITANSQIPGRIFSYIFFPVSHKSFCIFTALYRV